MSQEKTSEQVSFSTYLEKRKQQDKIGFYDIPVIQKAYYVGGYAQAVILSSWNSDVSKENTTFKNWLSNQIINFKNLERIFEIAFRFEQKLRLRIRNDSEVRKLSHEVQPGDKKGISSSKISFAFVAGFDDYRKFLNENPLEIKEKGEKK